MMWKHRDTGAPSNFVERVESRDGNHAYVALFNEGDSALCEAWTGMNDAGFAIMNTASYNLMPDTAAYKDQEGRLMSLALARCATVDDFEQLLRDAPKPMGVQANFGVMDAHGGLAYFETDDYRFTRFDVADSPQGYLLRTNHSMTGNDTDGYGYIRYQNALDILKSDIEGGTLLPESFTEKASRSFWHSLLQRDYAQGDDRWVVDQDFIPRYISTASIVVEGVNEGSDPAEAVMWTMLGYPPCSWVEAVSIDNVPDGLRGLQPGCTSAISNEVMAMKELAFPLKVGNGQRYIDMKYLRQVMEQKSQKSKENYKKYRK